MTISTEQRARNFMKYGFDAEPQVYDPYERVRDVYDDHEIYIDIIMGVARSHLDDISFTFKIPSELTTTQKEEMKNRPER
jgi:hypothetical protein